MHFPTAPELDDIVTSKLIASLVKDCGEHCIVVEENGDDDDDAADAVLTGAMMIQTGNGPPRVQGAMRLVARDGRILWADTVYSSAFTRSASSSFANNTAKRLTQYLDGTK